MIRLALVFFGITTLVVANATTGNADSNARLTIVAVTDVPMEFRTLNLRTTAFVLNDGESRTFRNLKPGRYVVVQAPPLGIGLNPVFRWTKQQSI